MGIVNVYDGTCIVFDYLSLPEFFLIFFLFSLTFFAFMLISDEYLLGFYSSLHAIREGSSIKFLIINYFKFILILVVIFSKTYESYIFILIIN
jgi:hypothetical protein